MTVTRTRIATATRRAERARRGPATSSADRCRTARPGVEPVSEDPLPPLETVEKALALVREGRPFSAHEVLEARWKAGPDEERDLWQGLAQICVGLTHSLRGNAVGASRLVERGIGRIEQYAGTAGPTYGLDLDEVARKARARLAG